MPEASMGDLEMAPTASRPLPSPVPVPVPVPGRAGVRRKANGDGYVVDQRNTDVRLQSAPHTPCGLRYPARHRRPHTPCPLPRTDPQSSIVPQHLDPPDPRAETIV